MPLPEDEEPGKLETRSELAGLAEIWPRRLWNTWWMPFGEASDRDLTGEEGENIEEDDRRQYR